MIFYILTPFRIEAYDHHVNDFLADDLFFAIQHGKSCIATDLEALKALEKVYPSYHKYEVKIGKL